MNFNNQLKLDKSRTIRSCFEYFAKQSLDIETALSGIDDGNFVALGDVSFGFSRETAIKWDDFLISILNIKKLIKLISLKTLDKELKNLFKDYLANNEIDIFTSFQDVIEKLEKYRSNLNFHYFIVSGLKAAKIYQFDNIKIGNFNEQCSTTKLSFAEKIYLNCQTITNYKKENNSFNEMDEYWLQQSLIRISKYEGHTVLEVSNFGDDESSINQSINDAESFINELIFLGQISLNNKFDIKLNIPNQENTLPLIVNYNINKISSPSQDIIYTINLNLEKNLSDGNNIGNKFKELNFPLYSKLNENDLLAKLKIAINWQSSSLRSQNNRESFLFCAIGLEALLTTGRESITKSLAENTAFLIADKDIESRKFIYSQIVRLYSHRSGIAHGGNINIEIKDLNQIRYYLSVCIITIIIKIQKDELNTVKDLIDFFEDQKSS